MAQKRPLRERIRDGGGFYRWFNERLVRYGGPAQVGPYGDAEPPPCESCGRPKSEHITSARGDLRCPDPGASDA
ncbi:hypothetical protein [Microbacterium sp. G2-8]|uniref:hypothetical protein n=1 Tax=Microbacterium sp. G2-8 TaxID=2842454 RepID=UPI001C89A519|nr:hypothetical protein [Microbacterium sp. G2-8]